MSGIWMVLGKTFLATLVVTAILGLFAIPVLRRLKFGQNIRSDGPSRHLSKRGTPTMGGGIFLGGILAAGLIFVPGHPDGILVLATMLGYGMIGFIDDYLKIALKRPMGLRAREKLAGQVLVGAFLALLVVSTLGRGTDIVIPFSGFFEAGGRTIELGIGLFTLFTVVVVVSAANAVNLTDGLDGLAAGVTAVSALAFMLIAIISEKTGVALMMAAVVGGCTGFLLYNLHPARVFMGDTGSLALGGALGAAAVITRSELFLLLVGGIFVLETLSVIIQVFSFRVLGRRALRMAPLHHHFELGNWSENRVVLSFVLAGVVFALLGIVAYYRLG